VTVALIHYHLRRGGVTRVLEAQSEGLTQAGVPHLVLAGTPYEGQYPLPHFVDQGLDYRDAHSPPLSPEGLLARLEEAAIKHLGAPPDLWHFHNHTLGKNTVLSQVVGLLARRGTPLLLQLHDFAEDGRPDNFQKLQSLEELYPVAPHIHYAFINSRDQGYLESAGLPSQRAHNLPNAVTVPTLPSAPLPPSPLVLYPVRGIRRKNLGELCLLAALAPTGSRFAVSLAPENPQWHRIHEQWISFATELDLPVEFGVVGRIPPVEGVAPTFENWLAHSSHIVTTSVAEGFGLTFLEPLALGMPLIGRDLPEITKDFKTGEAQLGQLYQAISIPLELVDAQLLRIQLGEGLLKTYQSYQMTVPSGLVERTWQSLTAEGSIDFGNLPEAMQEGVIRKILKSQEEISFATWIRDALQAPASLAAPSKLDRYTLIAYQERLLSIYHLTTAEHALTAPEYLSRADVLHQFLKSEPFHFLRT